jgi:hypothetical protein
MKTINAKPVTKVNGNNIESKGKRDKQDQPILKRKASEAPAVKAAVAKASKATQQAKAKAKAKVAAEKAKAKAKADAKRASDAIAKAKEKKRELERATNIARNAQINSLSPADMRKDTAKELDAALTSFIKNDLGVKATSPKEMQAMQSAFHKGATSIQLVKLSKCAHAIGTKLGFIPLSDKTVSNETCKACYPGQWDNIRNTYNKVAGAFKKHAMSIGDTHQMAYNMRASEKVTKKGGKVRSGQVAITARIAKGKVSEASVKLTTVLAKNAIQIAIHRVNGVGSCVVLSKSDFLRYVRHNTIRSGKNSEFSIGNPPEWMNADVKKEFEKRINDNVEKADVTMAWLQSQARIAAKVRGIKVAA